MTHNSEIDVILVMLIYEEIHKTMETIEFLGMFDDVHICNNTPF